MNRKIKTNNKESRIPISCSTFINTSLLFVILFFSGNNVINAQLSYAEGGPAVEDPGLEVAPELRRYVDSVSGNDANDGKTQATAWKTISKVISERANFTPGFNILFKRGQTWEGSLDFITHPGGEENKRIVIGAYGSLEDSKPKLNGTQRFGSYFMVRDIQFRKLVVLKSHHTIIYNNVCYGGESNGILISDDTHYIAVVGNLVYDILANDGIVLHQGAALTGVGNHHWVLDNISIGNSGMEDCIDVAAGNYTDNGYPKRGDVKVVANQLQGKAVPGLSTKTGRSNKLITSGHDGIYYWIVGNIMTGSGNTGFKTDSKKIYEHISGNISYNAAMSVAAESWFMNNDDTYMAHNTIIHTRSERAVVRVGGLKSSFTNNLLMRTFSGDYIQGTVETMYNNFTTMNVSGISVPEDTPFNNDPRNWKDPSFVNYFIPDGNWSENKGSATPGAFQSDGYWRRTIEPFEGSDLENGGLGWEGPALVQQRLKELGISFGDPLLAKAPNPKDKSVNVSLDSDLSWETGDSTISHDVYFGPKPDSLIFMGNQTGTTFNPGTLKYETVYYWRVDQVTVDSTVPGTLWSFTKKEEPIPPALAANPNPADGEVEVRTSLLATWDSGARTRSVNFYFGKTNPPALVGNQEENNYSLSGLELNTKYYWRIDGINEWGTTEGEVWEFTTQAVPTLPEGWAGLDIGKVGINGDDDLVDGQFVLTASGKSIGENSDQFRYVYHSLSGNGEIVARIVSIENTSSSAIAGIMIRETLDSTSSHHMIGVTSEQGIRAKWRLFDGGATSTQAGSSVIAPYWLKLKRVSNYIISSESANGQTWKTIKTEQIEMQSDVYMGLAVTSGTNDSLCTAVFDNVSINGVIVNVEDEKNDTKIPKEFTIGNYPNPFNPTTTIKYDLPKHGDVKIQIYYIKGSLVEELVNGKQNAGFHSVIWNGRNNHGVQTASGIYLYRVQFNDQIKTAKMIFIK